MRLITALLALLAAPPSVAQQSVMSVPLTGSGTGLQTAMSQSSSGAVVAVGPVSFYGVTITLIGGQGPGYILVFDDDEIPPDGPLPSSGPGAPMRCLYVDGGPRTTTFGSSGYPLAFMTGAAWAFSTGPNCQTKASSTANFVAVSYKQQRR